jgi:hypothetical protein
MMYTIEMGVGAMIYIQSSIKIGSAIPKLIIIHIQTHRLEGDLISLLLFYSE